MIRVGEGRRNNRDRRCHFPGCDGGVDSTCDDNCRPELNKFLCKGR